MQSTHGFSWCGLGTCLLLKSAGRWLRTILLQNVWHEDAQHARGMSVKSWYCIIFHIAISAFLCPQLRPTSSYKLYQLVHFYCLCICATSTLCVRRLAPLSLTTNAFWSSCSCVLVRLFNKKRRRRQIWWWHMHHWWRSLAQSVLWAMNCSMNHSDGLLSMCSRCGASLGCRWCYFVNTYQQQDDRVCCLPIVPSQPAGGLTEYPWITITRWSFGEALEFA